MKIPFQEKGGFTLIEVMVALAVAGVVSAAMYAFQESQIRSHVTQEVVVNMHQNARAAMHFLTSEIRMAGCDPSGSANARITNATENSITFTMDFTGGEADGIDNNGNGQTDGDLESYDDDTDDPGEMITYQLSGLNITRTDHNLDANPVVLAENFDALNFAYFDAPDEDGNRNRLNPPTGDSLSANEMEQIHAIQITVLARSGRDVPGFMYSAKDSETYSNSQGDVLLANPGDNFRRILLTSEVRLRNAGLI